MWQSGIEQGDCVAKLAELEPGSVDLAFADPPFNIGYKYDVYDDRKGYEQYLEWSRQWMRGVVRALKPTGTFWLAIGDEYAAELKLIAQNDLRLTCRSWVIWYYTFGVNCTQKFNRSHAHLFHFVKDGRIGKFTFNAQDANVRVPSARQLVYADGRANPDGRLPDDTWILRPQDVPDGFAAEQDTWYFPRVAGTFKERAGFHGCQMPEQLLGRIIRISSNPGDLVLDPFGGSGTTLVVAKKLGRQHKGFELSKDYAAKIRERLNGVREGQALDGSAEPQRSAPTTPRARALDLKSGIIEAFEAARAGLSVDHVLANPEINEAFVSGCQRRSLPGQATDWNRFLLRLRKAKELPKLEVIRRRILNREEIDEFGFASEMALREMTSSTHLTLDEILCDQELAAQFDRRAQAYCPGRTPFEYRWAALALRKYAREFREYRKDFSEEVATCQLQGMKSWDQILRKEGFAIPGVYMLQSENGQKVYVGASVDLHRQLRRQFELSVSPGWSDLRVVGARIARVPSHVGVSTTKKTRESRQHRCAVAIQSTCIQKYRPMLNIQDLAAVLSV
ncbi:MAG: DNA methyltransferase [Planctomycetia bacterium]|nr:DNA methyltransferase [Planctomycetia bacterium]